MPGVDKPTGRVIALIVLIVFVAAALRGYFPTSQPASPESSTEHPMALAFVVVMLSVSIVIVAFSIIARIRDPRTVVRGAGVLSETLGGGGGRRSWRVLLIGLAIILAWLLMASLLAPLIAHHGLVHPTPATPTSTPAPGNATAPPPSHGPENDGRDVMGYLAASTVTLLVLLVAGTVIASRRQRRITEAPVVVSGRPESVAASPKSLARAAELGLAEIGDLSREPRQAIIACYAAMERELTLVPEAVPQDFDTPTEVLARAVEHHALHADNAIQLVNLFEEARFSSHVMNERHREVAENVLRLVLAELRSIA